MSKKNPRNPYPCVDIIIYDEKKGIVLIKRKNPPYGWALPGGFIDYGESAESAAIREAEEETKIKVELKALHGVYSEPGRDPRFHTLSISYLAKGLNLDEMQGSDDAAEARFFLLTELPLELAFDHGKIIADFKNKIAEASFDKLFVGL